MVDSQQRTPIAPVSPEARTAFSGHMPRLLVFVNDKFSLENRFSGAVSSASSAELIAGFNRQFGELLAGVYEFSLYEELAGEFVPHITTLESRGIGLPVIDSLLKSWIMAIQSNLTPGLSGELVQPLQWLLRSLGKLHEASAGQAAELDKDAQTFTQYILQRNRKFAAETLLSLIREGMSIEDAYTRVLLPSLEHIERRWRKNDLCIAEEHVANDICRYVMFRVIDSIFGERKYPFKALVTCMPDERHTLGAEIFANFLEIKGWSVYFAGQAGSRDEILHAVTMSRPQVVVLSVPSIAGLPAARDLAVAIRAAHAQMHIVTEGRAALLARSKLETALDGTLAGFEAGHAHMLSLVMPDA
jgi:methanogenic corrinoid protein MtbC1